MPVDFAALITAGIDFITDLGLLPIIAAGAVVAVGTMAFSKAKRGAR